jgi:hypothetical protein
MYVNPMGIAMREITAVNVALNASAKSPTCAFVGNTLLVEVRIRSKVDEQIKNRMKVPTRLTSKFRLLWELPLSVDNIVRADLSLVGGYLGRMVLTLTMSRSRRISLA